MPYVPPPPAMPALLRMASSACNASSVLPISLAASPKFISTSANLISGQSTSEDPTLEAFLSTPLILRKKSNNSPCPPPRQPDLKNLGAVTSFKPVPLSSKLTAPSTSGEPSCFLILTTNVHQYCLLACILGVNCTGAPL